MLLEEIREEGREEGRTEGREKSEERTKLLAEIMEAEGRESELLLALKDPTLLHQLYEEYHIGDQ